MKIILYGIGSGRLRVEKYLKKEHEIIGYSDSFFEGDTFNNNFFYTPIDLLQTNYDFIVITIGESGLFQTIKQNLIDLGIKQEKILNFYESYPYYTNLEQEIIDTQEYYDGVILGLSHSHSGISKKYLKKNFFRLSAPMQDLFYNLKKIERNIELIKKCNYVIIDMYTYTYFNYDVSMSAQALNYIYANHFEDVPHNFEKNINFKGTLKNEINRKINRCVFEDLFNINNLRSLEDSIESGAIINDDFLDLYINKCVNSEHISGRESGTSFGLSCIQKKIFTNTENENIQIFENILKILRNANRNMKIYIILIPQHKIVENNLKIIEKKWKYRFYDIINSFKYEYDFEFLDFKNTEEIYSNDDYYKDLSHLNYNGAVAFTKLLNSYILY